MIKNFFKTNFLIVFLALIALVTALPAPVETFPGNVYISRICLFFCFMIAAAGFDEGGIYLLIHAKMRAKLSERAAYFAIIITAYFTAALLTPYAVIIAVIPLITRLFDTKTLFYIIPLTSAAAVFGGFLSPISSFQNSFLTFEANLISERMFFTLLPFSLIGIAMVIAISLPVPKVFSQYEGLREVRPEPVYISVFAILLIITSLAAEGIFDSIASFVSVCLVVVILEPKLVRKPLYSALIMLFLLTVTAWNITRADLIPLPENPYFAVVALSNIITAENAAAFLLAGGISPEIIAVGANIGAAGFVLGTPCTLLAYAYSISYENAKPLRSLLYFAFLGAVFTAVLTSVYFVLPR
jgi:hypothetical protein